MRYLGLQIKTTVFQSQSNAEGNERIAHKRTETVVKINQKEFGYADAEV